MQSFVVATSSGLTSSVQLGPSISDDQPSSSSANGAASIDAITLDSEVGCIATPNTHFHTHSLRRA